MVVEGGKIKTTGTDSTFTFRVIRNGEPVLLDYEGDADLKRFKDKVREVDSGNECGLSLQGFTDFREGDVLECYRVDWRVKTMTMAADPSLGSHSGVSGSNKDSNRTASTYSNRL